MSLPRSLARTLPPRAARLAIRAYQLTLSGLIGRQCRHWPSCSAYADAAIARHGLWPGAWMGFARVCRCGPFGTHGIDLVPERPPAGAAWYRPWVYARWRGVEAPPPPTRSLLACGAVEDGPETVGRAPSPSPTGIVPATRRPAP